MKRNLSNLNAQHVAALKRSAKTREAAAHSLDLQATAQMKERGITGDHAAAVKLTIDVLHDAILDGSVRVKACKGGYWLANERDVKKLAERVLAQKLQKFFQPE